MNRTNSGAGSPIQDDGNLGVSRWSSTLVVVPCGLARIWDKNPNAGPTPARFVYIGAPFIVNREYAERFGDAWVVLSAKYGFLNPTDIIPGPYNVTFKRKSTKPTRIEELRSQVRARGLHHHRRVIGLGGSDYREPVQGAFARTGVALVFPFAGMPIGVSMGAVKRALANDRPLGDLSPLT